MDKFVWAVISDDYAGVANYCVDSLWHNESDAKKHILEMADGSQEVAEAFQVIMLEIL